MRDRKALAKYLWQIGWDQEPFTLLVVEESVYLFGPLALRAAYAQEAIPDQRCWVFPAFMIRKFPRSRIRAFKQALIENLGAAHEKMFAINATRQEAAAAIRDYRSFKWRHRFPAWRQKELFA